MTASAGPLGHAGGTSFGFLPGWSNLDRPNWFTRYPRVPRNPFPSDGPNNANNKQNFANIFNGSQQQGCNAALPFPKPMRIASSCRSSLKFRKIFHGNDRNNHRNQSPPLGRGYSTISNSVVTSALRCQYVSSRRLRRAPWWTFPSWGPWPSKPLAGPPPVQHTAPRKRSPKLVHSIRSKGCPSRAWATWRMNNLKNEQLDLKMTS